MPRKNNESQPNLENDSGEGIEQNSFKLPEEEPVKKSLKKIESEELKNSKKIKKLKVEVGAAYGTEYKIRPDFGTKKENYFKDLEELRKIISLGAISPLEVLDTESAEAEVKHRERFEMLSELDMLSMYNNPEDEGFMSVKEILEIIKRNHQERMEK